MSTRSVTYVYNDHEVVLAMYRQSDGYPSGMGKDLLEFLGPIKLVNGLSINDDNKVANGMGCLAAQLVAEFKNGPGGIYLVTGEHPKDHRQEYEYHIALKNEGGLFIGVRDPGIKAPLFEGDLTPEDFGKWIADYDE